MATVDINIVLKKFIEYNNRAENVILGVAHLQINLSKLDTAHDIVIISRRNISTHFWFDTF